MQMFIFASKKLQDYQFLFLIVIPLLPLAIFICIMSQKEVLSTRCGC